MPGNELGDRVHNFFAQDNSSHGQHQSRGLEGNWPVPNNNFWVGSPRPVDVLNSSPKSYSGQNPEIDRGQSSYPVRAAHGLNFYQSNLRPEFSRNQPLNEQQYSNGYMYGNRYSQGRQNEANFRELDAYSNQRHLVASRGLLVNELQRISGHEQLPKAPDRSGTSVSPVSFDLFGGQQQMNHQRQQSGLNDMQQLHQQLMIRKMEELQRQQQLQQLDSRPQNPINQVPQVTKQASGSQSSLFNETPNSDALRNPWTAESGTNWLAHSSAAMQGSPSGITFLPNVGQTHRLIDGVHQQADQSLYGIPISNSRGSAVNQYSLMVTERSSMPQMPTSGNSLHSNQHNFLPDGLTGQEGISISRQNFQNETNEHDSCQSLNTSVMAMGFHQQVNSLQNNATHQDCVRRQELSTLSETSQERYPMQVTSPQNEVTLDPAEEKILYGSDDNIWSAFGKIPSISGEAGNVFDSSGISNGVPSLQSGSWSALMQSAVAETSSADIGPQEEWSGLNFHNNDGSSANQSPLIHNENVKQSSFPNDGIRIPSAMVAESSRSSDSLRPTGLNQLGHTFQGQPSEAALTDVPQRFGQSVVGTRKWLNHNQAQNLLAGESDIHGNALENSVGAERNGNNFFADWPPGQGGTKPQPNGWTLAPVPPAGDRALNTHDAEKVSQNHNNQVRAMQGQLVDECSLWKSSSLTSAVEFGSVRSMTGNHQANKSKGDLGFHNAASSVANSCNMLAGDGANLFAQNNYLLNQWKHASPSTKSRGGESLGRMMDQVNDQNQGSWKSSDNDEMRNYDRENCAMKENSNDSHPSNLSNHASGGFRESGTVDAIDSRSLSSGKQKSSNQLAKKASAPRKFQYHPMGNLDDDVGPTHGLKQPTQAQGTPLQSAHFGQLKLFGQVPRNLAEKGGELPKDSKHLDNEPSGGSFTGYAPGTSSLFSQSFDSSTNKASSPSQNMLELLHKVDQSRDQGSLMHLSSSDCNLSSQPPEAENSDGSAGHVQRSKSSFSKGFGLQLGPPSQLLQIPDLSSSPQYAQSMVNATDSSLAGIGMGEKSMHMASSLQSRQFSNEKSQMEYENNTSSGPRHPGNDNSASKGSDNYHSAFTSDAPYMRSQLQNKQATRPSTRPAMNQHIDSSFSYSTSHSMDRSSTETVLPDASGNFQKNSLPSSGGTAQQSGPYDVLEIGPAGTASSRDQIRGSQHFGMPGVSRQGSSSQVLHNMWSNVPTPNSAAQYSKGSTHFHELPQPNILESSSRGDLDVGKGGYISSKSTAIHADTPIGVDGEEHRSKENSGLLVSASKIEVSLGSASSIKNHLDESPANSTSTQKDIEDFGRSLKPNTTFSNEKFALLNQMRTLKNAESDPSIRFSKRIKGPENVHDIHQSNLVAEKQNQDNFRNSLGLSSGVPPEDSTVFSFSTPSDRRNTSPHGNAAPEDVAVVSALHDSRSKPSADASTVRVEHHMVSPLMAPSWFNQYGSLQNGPLLSAQNVRHVISSRPEELPFTPGTASRAMDTPYLEDKTTATPVEAYVSGALKSSAPTVEANEQLSSPPSLQMNVAGQRQVILRPKKRKSATSELLSWYKEITHCSQSPSILSVVDANWSKAANRLTEKVEDDIDLIEDGPPVLRSKRRLILTTELMQQLFYPPPATVLSADASTEHESVAYAVSRVALGDACSALSTSSNLGSPHHDIDLHAVKGKLNGDLRFAKVIEDLLGKAMKLENDFLRLDKSASILDLRLECQDLEKFSVINRFAKFHGRGQTDNAETSTDAIAATQKPCAQRYVTAVPMPRSLPDRMNGMIKLQEDGHDVSSNVLEAS